MIWLFCTFPDSSLENTNILTAGLTLDLLTVIGVQLVSVAVNNKQYGGGI